MTLSEIDPSTLVAFPARVESLEARLDAVKKDNARKEELLIRMDERLKSIQDRSHIPHGEGGK
jgi:hypothetical protein